MSIDCAFSWFTLRVEVSDMPQVKKNDFQAEKKVVRAFNEALDNSTPQSIGKVLSPFVSAEWHWRGMHPFHEQRGVEAVVSVFWTPLRNALKHLQRRPDIFIAGLNEVDGFKSTWVVEMGHLMGLFDQPWLGIRPTQRIAMLRYCEFNRVMNGKIVETAMFCDIPHLMMQAGQNPFPPQTGAMLVQPGPRTHDGLCHDRQDPARGEAALAAIDGMLGSMKVRTREEDPAVRLQMDWRDDMIWWGPAGIGATYTIERYLRQHSFPFRDALVDYKFNGHIAKLAERDFGGFFGWANLTLRNAGGYLGMTAGPGLADMRVIDMYRVEDGKLAENWIFIDILHFLNMQGLDVLKRMEAVHAGGG